MSITRSITRPIVRGIARGIVRSGLDPDAAAYIAAVEAALSSSISGDQKNAINTFFKTGKSDGWYSSLKRLYLPIWADASANALCMVSGTSGTFSVPGGVDNSNVGYVQGNGTSGFFRSDTSAFSVGRTESTGLDFILVNQAPTQNGWYCGGTSTLFSRRCGIQSSATAIIGLSNTTTTQISASLSQASQNGIFCSSRTASNLLSMFRRTSSGFSSIATPVTTTETVTAPTTKWVAMARAGDNDIFASLFTNARMGSYGFGIGLTSTNAEAFTLALKNLWETASGLTLP